MEIIDGSVYAMKVTNAIVVNDNTQDDPMGDCKRVQICIPSLHTIPYLNMDTYMAEMDKKSSKYFGSYPWVWSTITGLNLGDYVYVANLDNQNGEYVIIGRDARCDPNASGGTNGIGGSDGSGIVELLVPFIIRQECGYGSPPLYDQYWDSNIAEPCAIYDCDNSPSWAAGLLNWDSSRAYKLAFEIASKDSNWKSYFPDSEHVFVKNLSYDVSTLTCRTTYDIYNAGRSYEPGFVSGMKKFLSSSIAQEVQKTRARADVNEYISGLLDEGISNPAALIYMGDFVNQWGAAATSGIRANMHNAAKNLTALLSSNSSTVESAVKNYQNPDTMMKEAEALHIYYMAQVENFKSSRYYNNYKNRGNARIAYIRELFKQGKLSNTIAGLTMVGNLVSVTKNGLTLLMPFEGELVEQSNSGTASDGNRTYTQKWTFKMPKGIPITSLFGRRGLGKHNGVDFGAPNGTTVYASHDGSLIIKDSGIDGMGRAGASYGYYATITFQHNNEEWKIICAHMIRNSAEQFGFKKGQTYQVKAGQAIGLVDSTGNSSGPHLHYTLQRGSSVVNPLPYLGMGDAHYPITSDMTNYLLE